MNAFWLPIFLGVVQGLTEFLPISSSAHLVMAQEFFGVGSPDLFYDTMLHWATLGVVFVFFWKDILKLSLRELKLLLIGSIPAGLVGVLFKDYIEALFGLSLYVGVELMISGVIILWADRMLDARKKIVEKVKEATIPKKMSILDAFLVGCAQAVAISPGISRSGSTVTAALARGISREEAFRFSFLLSIPAIAGAGLLQVLDVIQEEQRVILSGGEILGIIIAFVVGLLTLKLFKLVITKAKLEYFGWYCIVAGALFIVSQL